jgi:hypothetical protein
MAMIELVDLGASVFAAHAKLMLALCPIERIVQYASDVLATLWRSVSGGFKIASDVDVGSIVEGRAGDEASQRHACEIGIGIGEGLVEVVDASR